MMAFTRTPRGLVEKWRFHKVPTVWIEGPTDFIFYAPVAEGLPCRFESFHGRENARALVDSLKEKNYPYLVILDGDYCILKKMKSIHRRVIMLSRYSYENFLWEPATINRVCLVYAQCGDQKDLVKASMDDAVEMLESKFLPALILDVAARRMNPAPKVLPSRIEPLLESQTSAKFASKKLFSLVNKAREKVDASSVAESERDIAAFLKGRCISHIVRGHYLFGLLRRIFVQAANKERGSKTNASDDALLQMFSDAIWRHCREGDHKRLKRNFRTKLRELSSSYS